MSHDPYDPWSKAWRKPSRRITDEQVLYQESPRGRHFPQLAKRSAEPQAMLEVSPGWIRLTRDPVPTALLDASTMRGLETLYANQPFEARVALPDLKRLWIGNYSRILDERTLANMPSLELVKLGPYYSSVPLSWLPTNLDTLFLTHDSASKRSLIAKMTRLHTVGGSIEPDFLSELPTLRRYIAKSLDEKWTRPSAWQSAFKRFGSLEVADLNGMSFVQLSLLAPCQSLRGLGLGDVKSLRGIQALGQLEVLRIDRMGNAPDFEDLRGHPGLRKVYLTAATAPANVDALGTCQRLERLMLDCHDGGRYGTIPDFRFAAPLQNLESLDIRVGHVLDADLGPLLDLPKLRYLAFGGRPRPADLKRLRSRGVRISVYDVKPQDDRPTPYWDAEEKEWILSGSFCGQLGFANNHALERALLAKVPKDVRKRLDPDSESAMLSISAATRGDIRAVQKAFSRLERDHEEKEKARKAKRQ